jgi:bacteriocin biosynthesis cyclodehydratase domain-containing protein
MIVRLDPDFPPVWRTPDSVQFGIDRPAVVLTHVSTADERMLGALAVGVPISGLSMIGLDAGASEQEVRRLLRELEPVLRRGPVATEKVRATVALAGGGPTLGRISATLVQCGLEPHRADVDRSATATVQFRPDLAVVVTHYVVDPVFRGYWLRQDVPHLAITFSDAEVHIGPMIEPGVGPCLFCLELGHADADRAWPAIASQLLGRASRSETPLVSAEVAALASRMVLSRVGNGPAPEPVSWHLDVATGRVATRLERAHPACRCTGLENDLAG